MWHEARRQEKKVREVMVNLQRRAERRKEHYERLVWLKLILCKIPCFKNTLPSVMHAYSVHSKRKKDLHAGFFLKLARWLE